MPAISVILPTYRPGGLEFALRTLRTQTFEDFEVVIADEHIAARRDLWAHTLHEHDIAHVFADMSRSAWPRASAPIAHNEAARVASGELLIFLSDYAVAQPDWLETHWRVWTGCDRKYCAMGPFRFLMPPAEWLDVSLPIHVSREWMAENNAAYSIFKDPELAADEAALGELPAQVGTLANPTGVWAQAVSGQDPKLTMPEGPISYSYYYNKNEAVPLKAFLDVNGADESFVGLHPYDDAVLALRLHKAGVRWWLAQSATINIVQVRHFMDAAKWDTGVSDAAKQFERVRAYIETTGDYRTPNDIDLCTERAKR